MALTPTLGMRRIGQSCGRNSEKVKNIYSSLIEYYLP